MDFPSKDEFRAWLLTLPAKEIVAEEWRHCDCPLARFLAEAKGVTNPYIKPSQYGDAFWGDGLEAASAPLPAWANSFGLAIDAIGRYKGRCARFGAVRRADCLRVLG